MLVAVNKSVRKCLQVLAGGQHSLWQIKSMLNLFCNPTILPVGTCPFQFSTARRRVVKS